MNIKRLQQLAKIQKLPHAILLLSNDRDIAAKDGLNFAKWLLCGCFKNNQACGNCENCNLIDANTHVDFLRIEPLESGNNRIIKINQIREIVNFAQTKSQIANKKVVLIINAECMNIYAANALLKVLEEPPNDMYLILTTTCFGLLIDTIKSRCTVFDLYNNKENNTMENQLIQQILADLDELLIQKVTYSVLIAEKWSQHEVYKLLEGIWIIISELIRLHLLNGHGCKVRSNAKLLEIYQLQSLHILWKILEQVENGRQHLLKGQSLNIQLFLESLFIYWVQNV